MPTSIGRRQTAPAADAADLTWRTTTRPPAIMRRVETRLAWRAAIIADLEKKPLPLPPWAGAISAGIRHAPVHACPFCGGPMSPGCDETPDGVHRYDNIDACYDCGLLHIGAAAFHADERAAFPYGQWMAIYHGTLGG